MLVGMQGAGGDFGLARLAGRIAAAYFLLAAVSAILVFVLRNGQPWSHPSPRWSLPPGTAIGLSLGLGLGLTGMVVGGTRLSVRWFGWARHLHAQLRPVAGGLSLVQIGLLASASSLGEEFLFRGLIQPWLGWLPTSFLFGFAHQMPGRSRWVWVLWATVVGAAFGAIFEWTGSLAGALLAHGLINAINFAYLRDYDPSEVTETPPAGRG